jgi:hypothetical protein
MAKDPAFLFYSSDFLVGTYTMTDAQVGQYVRLMCLQHQHGHLDVDTIRSVMRGELDNLVMSKFRKDGDGRYYNERLDTEVNKRRDYSKSRADNRSKKTYVKDMNNICETPVEHMENENEDVIVNGIDTVNSTLSGTNIPPKLSDVKAYCEARGNSIDPEQFMNYYETRGWMAGKAKMKNWQSAVRVWERNTNITQPKSDSNVIWADQMREGEET